MRTIPPVGSRIRFKDYTRHPDWKKNDGQVARVTRHLARNETIRFGICYTLEVRWSDGDTSHVEHDNVELAIPMEANV